MTFKGEAQTFMAKIMSAIMTPLISRSVTKAIKTDLEDIKSYLENQS